jgi:crotonobetainyl-CoA:carnitine CoA-transferase CaiB-like acyl-CoA transferase
LLPGASGQPLSGTRVVDLTRNVAGPFATQILADLGADVIKLEHPQRGDDTRAWGPPFWNGQSAVFLSFNRNKRSLRLDLKDEHARESLADLIDQADVLVESFGPGALDRLGFGVERAHARNPALLYCSILGFGASGPLKDRPGYDPLMQAFGGLMSVTGEPGGEPVRAGVSVIDMTTGMWCAMAILSCLLDRAVADGEPAGRHIQVSLYETALTLMGYHLVGYWGTGESPSAQGGGVAFLCPYGTFEASDGLVVIAAANDGMFAKLCNALELDISADDPRFATNGDRVVHRDLVEASLTRATRRRTATATEEILNGIGIPCAPVLRVEGVAEHPQGHALGIFQEIAHPAIEDLQLVGLPILIDGERAQVRRPPPLLGEHDVELAKGWRPREDDD